MAAPKETLEQLLLFQRTFLDSHQIEALSHYYGIGQQPTPSAEELFTSETLPKNWLSVSTEIR